MSRSYFSSNWSSFFSVFLLSLTLSTELIVPTVALTPLSPPSSGLHRQAGNVLKYFGIGKNGSREFSSLKRWSFDLHFSRSKSSIDGNDVIPTKFEEGKELQWNVVSILQNHDRFNDGAKRKLLRAVFEQAMKVIERDLPLHQPSTVRLPAHLSSMSRFLHTSSIDKDHEGHFRVFLDDSLATEHQPSAETIKTTMVPNLLFSMDRPLSYIREVLSNPSGKKMNGSMICDDTEAVVFLVQNDQNLKYTSRVLDDMPLAQLHMGGNLPDCQILLDSSTVEKLKSLNLLKQTLQNDSDEINTVDNIHDSIPCNLKSEDLEAIRTFLFTEELPNDLKRKNSELDDDSNIRKTLIRLVDVAVDSARKGLIGESNEPHLVLVAHSTSASFVAAALSAWKRQKVIRLSNSAGLSSLSFDSVKNKSIVSRVEDLLHTAVTVVTIGSVCQKYCDGPAYIHMSMLDDHLSQTLGATRDNTNKSNGDKNNVVHGGKNAVYFNAWSPYDIIESNNERNSLRGHDAHNMNACAIQFLYLIMRINGITSFRALYDAANYVDPRQVLDIDPSNFAIDYGKQGDLVIPLRIDLELLPAMIRASGGDHCLWNPPSLCCDENEDDCPLPDEIESKTYLEESFGYSAYEEIYETCRSPPEICPIDQ